MRETCSNCGAEYDVTVRRLPMKDNDKEYCICGALLKSWNETNMYEYKLVKEGKKD